MLAELVAVEHEEDIDDMEDPFDEESGYVHDEGKCMSINIIMLHYACEGNVTGSQSSQKSSQGGSADSEVGAGGGNDSSRLTCPDSTDLSWDESSVEYIF